MPDGRLREQLRSTPPDRLLDLTGVRFIVTDKQRDLWSGNVYYDLEQTATLQPGESLTLDLASYPSFAATALGVVASGNNGPAQAEITMTDAGGKVIHAASAAESRGVGSSAAAGHRTATGAHHPDDPHRAASRPLHPPDWCCAA